MAFRIVWTDRALSDLRDIVRYIARDDRSTAERFGNLILSKVTPLETFPRIGRIVPEFREERLREIILSPYRIVFEVDDGEEIVAILRIWHGARGEPRLPETS